MHVMRHQKDCIAENAMEADYCASMGSELGSWLAWEKGTPLPNWHDRHVLSAREICHAPTINGAPTGVVVLHYKLFSLWGFPTWGFHTALVAELLSACATKNSHCSCLCIANMSGSGRMQGLLCLSSMTLSSVLRGRKQLHFPVMQKRSFSCGIRNSEPRKNLSCLAMHYSVRIVPWLASQVSRPRHICIWYCFILTNYFASYTAGSYPTVRDLVDTLSEALSLSKVVYCKFANPDGTLSFVKPSSPVHSCNAILHAEVVLFLMRSPMISIF